jgi:D-3-phosphoglycerate dehydrogenase
MQMVIDRFRPVFDEEDVELVVPPFKERFEEEELLGLVEDVDGVICGDDRFTERVLRAAPNLKVLSKWGTGIDSIDQAACRELGVAVCNTPNAFSRPVADTVLGYILS